MRGQVVEILPGNLYKIRSEETEFIAYLAGKMRFHHIRILLGDSVEIELDPYKGKTTNRIIKRL